jgi:hypothetical protein
MEQLNTTGMDLVLMVAMIAIMGFVLTRKKK